MILTNPALCSENNVKFSTKSSNRCLSQVPRRMTSKDTRRGSFSCSIRFHSKIPAAITASRQLIAHQRAKILKLQSDFAIEVLKSTHGQLGYYVLKTS